MSAHFPRILTIGHSTHTAVAFVDLLKNHGVTAVADVRSVPFSRFAPHFNRNSVERSLQNHNIKYVFLGAELGARSDDPSCYKNGRVQYELLARTALFRKGIDRIMHGAQEYRIALMCAEKEPLECHRTLLVARVLDESGVLVSHIRGNGSLETHHQAMERLLDVVGVPHEGLFTSQSELISEALLLQEAKVAYVDDRFANHASGNSH